MRQHQWALHGLTPTVGTSLTCYDALGDGSTKIAEGRFEIHNAPHLVALVRAGARFERGILIEREQDAVA